MSATAEPTALLSPGAWACEGLGESLWLPGSAADWKTKSLSCVDNRRSEREQSKLACYAEPQGGKRRSR